MGAVGLYHYQMKTKLHEIILRLSDIFFSFIFLCGIEFVT